MKVTHSVYLREGPFRLDLSFQEDDPLSVLIASYTTDVAERRKVLTGEEADRLRRAIRVAGSELDIRRELEITGASGYIARADDIRKRCLDRQIDLHIAQAEFRNLHSNYIREHQEV